jgi:hypothetical protein
MSAEENASPWKKREAQKSLQDDRKRPWDRHEDRINQQRADTSKHDARVQSREDARARWTGQSATQVTVSGVHLDAETARLKVGSDASRTAPAAAPISVDLETLAALIRDWKQNSANGKNLLTLFEENDWNREQLSNATQYLIQKGHPINSQLPEDAFLLCYNGNHLDPRQRRDRAGNVVHMRGEAARPAPVPFPRVVWADETTAIERERQENAVAAATVEAARAKSLPFDQLRCEATQDRKPARPLMGPGW